MTSRRAIVGAALLLVLTLTAGCPRRAANRMIQNKGSDTMVNIAQAWAEEYRVVRPAVAVAVSGGGTGTGIAAIINGTVDIANASREIKRREIADATRATNRDVVEHVVAYDAIAIYLHPRNPLQQIMRDQLACIYGEKGTCSKWTDLGVEVPGCAGQEIVRVSRQNNSGTYQYFREWVLGKGDFKLGSRDMQGSKDVADLVGGTPCAIGYSGMGYATKEIKVPCVAKKKGGPCVEPSIATAISGRYPISRAMYMYTVGQPGGEIARYLDWVRSDQGQKAVEQAGFAPLPKDKRRPVPAP